MIKAFSASVAALALIFALTTSRGLANGPSKTKDKVSPPSPAKVAPSPAPPATKATPAPAPPAPGAAEPSAAPKAPAPPPVPSVPGAAAPSPAPPAPGAAIPPQPAPAAPTGLVSLNFTGADLVEVIHVLAQYLKLNYTIDPAVKGTVTLYSAQPLRREDLLPIFHHVLRMNGAVAVRADNLYHIVPIKEGKGRARPLRSGEPGYAMQVVPARFFSVTELKKVLEPFVTPGGEIIDYPRGNFLILIDLLSNIQRLVEIKELIDVHVFAGARMELYQPKVASAEELSEEMTKVMQAYAASSPQPETFAARFVPIPRINRLLVISYSEAAWAYAKRWLEQVDTYAEGPGRRVFVYPVENGKAADLADILNQVLGRAPVGPRAPRRTLRDIHERVPSLQPAQPVQPPQPGAPPAQTGTTTGKLPGLYAVAPVPAPTPQPPPRPEAPPAVPGAPARPAEEEVRIVPDPATNSLIIFGTAQEFQNIKNILKELDIVPRQVLLDVLVAEVTLTDDMRFGVEYEILRRDPADVRIFDRVFTSRGSILSGLPAPSATGVGPTALNAIIGTGDAIRAFINALKSDSRVKVLSSPSILATDNRPARIQVGTEEPIATGTVTAPVTGGTTSSTTIQYRNTGRILTIIPQVNAQGLVNLQIKAEVSQRGPEVRVGQDRFPSFDTRDAETTAVVQDGETLVIGGIMAERTSRERVGIPFLMDVPFFGRLFGTTTDDVERTELIMLITPHVIRSKEEARSATEEFKQRLSTVVRQLERERIIKREEKKPPEESSATKDDSMTSAEKAQKPVAEITVLELTGQSQDGTRAPASKETRGVERREKPLNLRMAEVPAGSARLRETPEVNEREVKEEADWPIEFTAEIEDREEETGASAIEAEDLVVADAVNEVMSSESPAGDGAQRDETSKSGPILAATIKGRPEAKGSTSPKIAVASKATPSTRGPAKVWTVQVSAFAKESDALNLAGKLKGQGYDAYLVPANVNGRTWYRVRVGRFSSFKEAKALRETLKNKESYTQAFLAPL